MKNRKQKRNVIGLGMIWIIGILAGCGAEQEAQKGSFKDSSKEVRQEDIAPVYCYEGAEQEDKEQEDSSGTAEGEEGEVLSASGPLMEDSVLDLGNHIVAHYIVDEAEVPYIVLQDLDTYSYLYIPKSDDIETVMNVALYDTGVELRYMDRHGEIHDTEFPVIFPFERGDVIDITYYMGSIKKLNYTDAPFLPEVVWEDTIKQKDEYHKISLERVSQLYNDPYMAADYRLAVKDMDGNIICSQKMTIPYAYEEVYWLLDISGDGYDDIVFCTCFEDSSKYANNTTLKVLIWEEGPRRFYKRAGFHSSYYNYVGAPQWNQEHSVIIHDTDGFNDYVYNTEMYVFRAGEWQLYADLAAHSELGNDILFFSDEAEEERFYKGLDYYYIETFPLNEMPEQRLEDEELQEKSVVWKIKNDENNLKLYPTEGWELTSFAFGNEETVKWIKKDEK